MEEMPIWSGTLIGRAWRLGESFRDEGRENTKEAK
jgi:hypothetical protein